MSNDTEMKSIRQSLESLPADLAAKAIRAAEMTRPQMLTERVPSLRAAVQKGIDWSKSVEGYFFWNQVYQNA